MKRIFILSCFIAFVFVVLCSRSFISAAEVTDNYETAIDKVPLSPMQEKSLFSLLKAIRSVTSIMTSLSFCLE